MSRQELNQAPEKQVDTYRLIRGARWEILSNSRFINIADLQHRLADPKDNNAATRNYYSIGAITRIAVQKYHPAGSSDHRSNTSLISSHSLALRTDLAIIPSLMASPSLYLATIDAPHHFLSSGVPYTVVDPLTNVLSCGKPACANQPGTSRATQLKVPPLRSETKARQCLAYACTIAGGVWRVSRGMDI